MTFENLGIDHIGIAVRDLKQALTFYQDILGMRLEEIENVTSEKVKVAILYHGTQRIELLEAHDETSPIHKHIEKRGEGLHHVAYGVSNLAAQLKRIEKKDATMIIAPAPRKGAQNCQVAFLYPKKCNGVLIELVERP